MSLPRLYAILDVDLAASRRQFPADILAAWLGAGVRLVQLRAKTTASGPMLDLALSLMAQCDAAGARLLVNDRADVAELAGAAGVHVGQSDLPAADARRVVGATALVGLSTHNDSQVVLALEQPVDYLAIGPVFATATKARPDPVVGLEGVKRAVAHASVAHLPVVGIGGMTVDRAIATIDAGAASVAVVADLVTDDPAARARAYLSALR